jgi:DNA polymerase III delta subunit
MAKKKESTPLVQMADFERGLEEATVLPRCTVIRGPEMWFHDRAIRALTKRARALGMDVNQHDPTDPDFDGRGLFSDLRGGSLFAGAIFVVVRNAAGLIKKSGSRDSDLVALLKTYLKGDVPAGAVVIQAPSLRADHALVKATVAADGANLNFRKLYDSPAPWAPDPRKVELVLWIRERASERKMKLRSEDAVFLSSAIGNDLPALESELAKLEVSGTGDLQKSVGWQAGGTPWDVADKVIDGKSGPAVAAVEGLFSKGFQGKDSKRVLDPAALVAMLNSSLIKSVRQGIAVAEGRSSGMAQAQAAALAGIGGSPKMVGAALERATIRTGKQWSAMLDDLVGLDRRMKTGGTVDANDYVLFTLKWRSGRRA